MPRSRHHPCPAILCLALLSTSMLSAQPQVVFQERKFDGWTTVYRAGAGSASGSTVADGGAPGAAYRVRHLHDLSVEGFTGVVSDSVSPLELDPLFLDRPVRFSVDLRFEVDEGWNRSLLPELLWGPLLEQAGQLFTVFGSAEQRLTTRGSFGSHRIQLDPSDWIPFGGGPPPDLSAGAPPVRLGLLLQTTLVPTLATPEVEARIWIDNLTVEALGGDLVVSFAETYPPNPFSSSGLRRILGVDLNSFRFTPLTRNPDIELRVFLQLNREPPGFPAPAPEVKVSHPLGLVPKRFPFFGIGWFDSFRWFSSEYPLLELEERRLFLFEPTKDLVLGDPKEVEFDIVSCNARVGGVIVPCDGETSRCIYLLFEDLLQSLFVDQETRRALSPVAAHNTGTESATDDPATLLRSFRDQRMAQTPAGRYYRGLYDELSDELAITLIPRASLVLEIADAQPPWLDAIAAAVDGRDDETVLSAEMVADMLAIFDRFESEGSDRLRHVMRFERDRLDLEDLPGMTMGEAIELISERGGPPPCENGPTSLCLGDRFRVDVFWKDFEGDTGEGKAMPLSDDSGAFWFFDPANIELVVKALDGTALNDRFWFFYGALSNVEYTLTVTDTETGAVRMYRNPAGEFGSVGDTDAFTPDGSPTSGPEVDSDSEGLLSRLAGASSELLRRGVRAVFGKLVGTDRLSLPRSRSWPSLESGGPPPAVSCVPTATALCLNDGRFRVEVSWRDFSGRTGVGGAQPLTGDTGTFWFFDPENTELILKVLDGRAINDRFWFFYGALSNVEYTITVADTLEGGVRTYTNPLGQFGSFGDTEAF